MGAILYKYADNIANPTFIFNVGLVPPPPPSMLAQENNQKNQKNNIYFLSVQTPSKSNVVQTPSKSNVVQTPSKNNVVQTPSKNNVKPGYKTISSHYSYDPAGIILTIKKTLKPQNF